MKRILKIVGKVLLIVILLFCAYIGKSVFATSLQDSTLVVGTQNLVDAIIGWLTGIGITICGGYFIYYVYCLKTNDEGERRRNIQNIKTTLICMILITCGLALINTILSFYK
ncbi:MAG: hypothetical protein Q4G09_03465 [Clostridia bacterium]|nr:hypothetical protein [Clostridia bacterium]